MQNVRHFARRGDIKRLFDSDQTVESDWTFSGDVTFTGDFTRHSGALDIGPAHNQCLELQYGTFSATGANYIRIAENDASAGRGGCRIWVSSGGGLASPSSLMITVHAGFNSVPPSVTVVGNESIGASITSIRPGYDATTQNKYIDILVQDAASYSVAIESFGIGTGNQWRLGDFSESPVAPSSTYTIDVDAENLMFGVFNSEGEMNLAHYNSSAGTYTTLGSHARFGGGNNFIRQATNSENFAITFGANYDSAVNPLIRGFGSTSSSNAGILQFTVPGTSFQFSNGRLDITRAAGGATTDYLHLRDDTSSNDLYIRYNGAGAWVFNTESGGGGNELFRLTASGAAQFPAGTSSLPGINFSLDSDTGIYNDADNVLAVATGGTRVSRYSANGLLIDSGALRIAERSGAVIDASGYGQLWVKNTTPCELWFTDDAGTDHQIAFV